MDIALSTSRPRKWTPPFFIQYSNFDIKILSKEKISLRRVQRQKPFRHTWSPQKGRIWKKTRDFLDEFFESSSIHGLGHLARKKKHYSEHLFWILVLMLAIMGMIYMGYQVWSRYQYSPTVISMEKDYKNWNTTFAMATLCPKTKVNQSKLREIAEWYNIQNTERFAEFITLLAASSYENFEFLPEYDEITPNDYLKIIIEAKFNFSFKISNTVGIEQNELLIVTENGLCKVINAEVGFYFSIENFNRKLPIKRGNNDLVIGNPLDGEIFIQAMNMNDEYNMTFLGPFDIPDVSVRRYEVFRDQFVITELKALSIISSNSIRSLSPRQRKCRFFDESYLEISDIYSYNLCRMQCRANLAYQLCGCIPYFYKKSSKPYCDVLGMKCLGKHNRYLSNLREPISKEKILCDCLPLCNDIHYGVELENYIPWPGLIHMKFNMIHFPKTRLKREVIFGFSDLLVSIGGIAGLLLGCSVLSFIEIVYFLSLRPFFFINKAIKHRRRVVVKAN